MEEDSEVVAGELMYSTKSFFVPATRTVEFLTSLGFLLDRIVEQGVRERKLSFVPVSLDDQEESMRGRIHLLWENGYDDDLREAAERLHDLGFF